MEMNDDKLKALWGEDLFNYCYAKSVEVVGYPTYSVMVMAAIGKLHDDGILVVKAKVPGL